MRSVLAVGRRFRWNEAAGVVSEGLGHNLEVSVLLHSLEAMSAGGPQIRAEAGTDHRRLGLEDCNL